MSAFISTSDPEICVSKEKEIDHASGVLLIDLLLGKAGEEVIVEVKRPTKQYERKLVRAKEQVRHYLITSKLQSAIVYAPVLRSTAKSEIEESFAETPGGKVKIVSITPAIGGS